MARSRVIAYVQGAYGTYYADDSTLAYAQTLWPSMTHANLGVTPMITSGLPECSEISQSPLDFTKIFTAYTG